MSVKLMTNSYEDKILNKFSAIGKKFRKSVYMITSVDEQ